MSTAKITLRPPPNVEFVEGYPGIPPGAPDRPQAAVKGSVEVRLGPSGAKAKYVRVELRKIETLPSPPPNSFYSIVGSENPTVLWQASEEWGVLQSQDIPFAIRIPEAIPPSLSLEKGAGIKYELVGQVCVQGKTSFLRRSKPVVISTSTPIIIDKHEFHSTWPSYQKHESRQLMHENVLLNVERTQNCHGPGDRVLVTATIRSDALHTVILRGFEFTLKETTVFNVGLQGGHHKKSQPQVKINIIGEQKIPVNATLYGGMNHRSELSVHIPDSHTTTTLNSAKHIDVTYVLIVKALMGTGKPLIMELPVIVSNWPRNVSQEAIRRIGFVPSLSGSQTKPQQTSTLPNRSNGASSSSNGHSQADEFGVNNGPQSRVPASAPARGYNPPDPRRRDSEFSSQSHSANGQGRGFSIANAMDGEIPEEEDDRPRQLQTSPPRKPNWPSSEDEKTKLYEQAKAKVDQVQGNAQKTERADSLKSNKQSKVNGKPPASAPASSAWLSAEAEKTKLFEEAKAKAERVQGLASAPASQQSYAQGHGRGGSKDSANSFSKPSGQPVVSAGAALYASALVDRSKSGSPAAWTPTRRDDSASPKPGPATAAGSSSQQRFMSAEEEKAMLRRYEQATTAVQRHQESHFGPSSDASATAPFGNGNAVAGSSSGPNAYASPPPVAGPAPVSPPGGDSPPAWAPGGEFDESVPEKERYRRAFEAREAAARGLGSPSPASAELSPPASSFAPLNDPEKERFRRAFEARDAFQARNGTSPMSAEGSHDYTAPPPVPYGAPPAINGYTPSPPVNGYDSPPPIDPWAQPPPIGHVAGRAQPLPPAAPDSRPMTAAEEKAMLRARYAQEEGGSSSTAAPSYPAAPPPPPPLAPRPPREYIQETRDEDLRLQRALASPTGIANVDLPLALPPTLSEDDTFGLRLRPTSPFSLGLDSFGVSRPESRGTNGNGLMNGNGRSALASPPFVPPKVQM